MKLIVANWKMNGSIDLLNEFLCIENDNLILGLPFPFIALARHINTSVKIAAQDCSSFVGYGARTGEVSAKILKDCGTDYVIIGHSERRSFLGEDAETINQKVNNAINAGLKVIYCVSEDYLVQIENDLANIGDKSNLIIAYEPMSAIGTGNTPSVVEIESVANSINECATGVLYGGSVTSKNIGDILKIENIGGVLVGGASLQVREIESMLLQIQESN